MAKKSFSAGATKPGILNSDGGEKLKEIQAKLFLTQKMKCILKMA